MAESKANVLVLGAGSGGLIAGNLLGYHGFNVTIVEKSDYHLFQPGMLWIAFQGHDPARYMRKVESLVRPGVNLVKDTVTEIDLGERAVKLASGKTLSYDILIIALGVSYDYDAIPGNREALERFGDFYSGPEHAARLWKNFSAMKEGRLVVAAGDPGYKCTPAPHKAVFLASETLKKKGLRGKVKVTLAVPFVHSYASETLAKLIDPKLEEAGIEVVTMFTAESVDLEKKKLYSLEGEELDFDLLALIPVHKGPQVTIKPDSVTDDDGYIKVDKYTLQVEGYDDVYAVGDCTNAPTSKTGVTAHLGAEVVADRILGFDARFTGRTNCPLVMNGEASFAISTYDHPVIPVRPSKMKRFFEDLFIGIYWPSLKYPERFRGIFKAYFDATDPAVLGEAGW
ncbi:NAD(P)/FAD-dependent oxidoreductase [Stetteria hydrogenophila]